MRNRVERVAYVVSASRFDSRDVCAKGVL
jgi:hypothetical protein